MARFVVKRVRYDDELGFVPGKDEDRYMLGLFDTSVEPWRLLGTDCGEPEDQTFGRDWSWVVEELNKVAEERDSAAQRALGE